MELKPGYLCPPGYKQTEVGVIPDEWNAKPLKGKIAIAHGFPFASEHFASHGSYRLTTPGHFYEEGGFRDIGDKQKHYDGPVSNDYVLRPGDLIVAMTEQADGLLGSAAVIPKVYGYLHNQRLGRVKTLSSEIELGFLFHVFNSPSYRAKVRETAAGTKVKHTSPEKLLEISVRLPPPPEQRAIAGALSDVDALIGSLDQLIAKKRDLKQATMQQLLTGQKRLPGFHGEWEVKKIGELLKYERPDKYFVKSDDYQDSARTPVLTANKSFVLGHTNEDFGIYDDLPAIIFDDFTTDSKFVEFRFKIKSSAIKILKARSAEANLKCVYERMRLINFPVGEHKRHYISEFQYVEIRAPKPTEQTAIAEVLSDMDAELAALEQRRDKTRDLKQGMMQELLTGRTRLV